jgi:carboxylesterase type B
MKYHQFRGISDDGFIRSSLFQEIDTGTFAQRLKRRGVKIIMGECSDEHFVYGTWRPPQNNLKSMVERLQADYSLEAIEALVRYHYPAGKLPAGCKSWQDAFGRLYAEIQIHALERGMADALVRHGAGDLLYRYRIEWRAQCCDKRWPKEWGVTHGTDMAIWFWGDGDQLSRKEKKVVKEAFHDNLAKFLRGENMDWGTEHPLQIRRLRRDGSVVCEDDARVERGVRVWNILKRVGFTGLSNNAKL